MTDSSSGPPPLDPAAVRGVIFDLDGTLVDSYAAIGASLNRARAAYGLPALAAAEVRRRVGRGLETLIAELVGPDRVETGVELFRTHYAEVYRALTSALPDARSTLCELDRRGFRLAVASNKPSRFSEPILTHLALREHLDVVLGPEDVASHKPEPQMIAACLARMGIAAAEAVYVGDMLLDIETATRAGVPVILVAGGSSVAGELEQAGQRVLAGLGELTALLGRPAAPR